MRENRVCKASDVYSFGIVLWELLTWRVPYEALKSMQVRSW
jgi:serine/threonine protein kinase